MVSLLEQTHISKQEVVVGLNAFLQVGWHCQYVSKFVDVHHLVAILEGLEQQLLNHLHAVEWVRVLAVLRNFTLFEPELSLQLNIVNIRDNLITYLNKEGFKGSSSTAWNCNLEIVHLFLVWKL